MEDKATNETTKEPAATPEKTMKEAKAKAPATRARKGGDGAAAYGVYRDALGGEDILGTLPGFEGLDARHQAAWNAVAGAAGGGE